MGAAHENDDVNTDGDERSTKYPVWYHITEPFLLPVIIIVGLFAFISIRNLFYVNQSSWESRAKSILREYTEVQLDYSTNNIYGAYGSFNELREAGYIVEGVTRGNMLRNYSVWTKVDQESIFIGPAHYEWPLPIYTFTAVAFPRITRPIGYLPTFAVREDLVLRVYRPSAEGANPWGEDGDYGCRTWEPIR